MLAAHVEFELRRFAPQHLPARVQEEVAALYGWLATVKVNEILEPQGVTEWVKSSVLSRPLPPEAVDFVRENIVVALELVQDDQTRIADLLPKEVFDRAVAGIAGQDEMRRQVIHQVVTSSVYSRLIANVLYHGIKTFLVTENGMARAIPGATSLLRLSQSALNATVPQMEKNVDRQLVAFIDENIQQTIADSESFLNRSLDDTLLQRVGDELWESLSNETPARLTRSLNKEGMAAGGDVLEEAWAHLRGTQLVEDIVDAVVRSFFLRYGRQHAGTVLAQMGLEADLVAQELVPLLAPVLARARESGYLEASIRRWLAPFYDEYFGEKLDSAEDTP
jgi:hypothetical protein